jgi:hypothetical protein
MWNKIRKIGSVNGKVKIEGLRLKRRQGEQTAISTRVLTTLVIARAKSPWRSTVNQQPKRQPRPLHPKLDGLPRRPLPLPSRNDKCKSSIHFTPFMVKTPPLLSRGWCGFFNLGTGIGIDHEEGEALDLIQIIRV